MIISIIVLTKDDVGDWNDDGDDGEELDIFTETDLA